MPTPTSPCIKLCKIHPKTQTCEGCGRTMEDIRLWSIYSEAKRKQIVSKLIHNENPK